MAQYQLEISTPGTPGNKPTSENLSADTDALARNAAALIVIRLPGGSTGHLTRNGQTVARLARKGACVHILPVHQ